jgi:hypothetical protein
MRKRKLDNEVVKEIRERFLMGEEVGEMAKEYNVSYNIIYSIIRGTSYPEVTEGVDLKKGKINPRFSREEVISIRDEYKLGFSVEDLAVEYDRTHNDIINLLSGRTYTHITEGKNILKKKKTGRNKKVVEKKVREKKKDFAKKKEKKLGVIDNYGNPSSGRIRDIISDFTENNMTVREICLNRKVSGKTVRNILKGITYKNVTGGIDLTLEIPLERIFYVVYYEHIGDDWQTEYYEVFRSKKEAERFIEEHKREMEDVGGVRWVEFRTEEATEEGLKSMLTFKDYYEMFPLYKEEIDKYI